MSPVDPFEELGLGAKTPDESQPLRRRDLREPSTRRSRKAARKRAELNRASAPRGSKPSRGREVASSGPGRPGKPRKPIGKRVAAKLFSALALALIAGFAVTQAGGLLLLSPTTATAASSKVKADTIDGQKLSVANANETPVSRDSFAALSSDELYDMTVTDPGYTVNNSGVIRWPFNVAVALGDRFGTRAAPCAGCSTFHRGTDFETGDKAAIYSVAAGVVTVSEYSGSLGQHVAIEHDVNGMKFTSIYGHMTAGSAKVKVGDTVTEGELLGLTGSTGESTGPHLDFEIDVDGTPIDSFVWLKKYTKH